MADIFISYARKDGDSAAQLAAILEQAGFSVWWDRQMTAGTEFARDIERELALARAVIVLWSSTSIASHWVRDEAGFALRQGTLLPVLLESIEPPLGFRQIQAVDWSDHPLKPGSAPQQELFATLKTRLPDGSPSPPTTAHGGFQTQRIKYCRGRDGTSLAYALMGEGVPVVKAGNLLTHIDLDARSFAWRHVFSALSKEYKLLRYDIRGMGLSQRRIPAVSFDDYVADLEAVVDAAGLERFALLGFSQGCPVSLAYAARHPERVSCIALTAGYSRGWRIRLSAKEQQREEAFLEIVTASWEDENPFARQMFTSTLAPRASREEMDEFNDLLRQTTNAENLVSNLNAMSRIDISDLLPDIQTPTCLFHMIGDTMNASIEEARTIASAMPNADLVALEGNSHLVLESDAVWPRYMGELKEFLAMH